MGAYVSRARELISPGQRFSNLGWDAETVKAVVANGALTDVTSGSDSPTRQNRIFCEICYRYFRKINGSVCCKHRLCSACYTFVTAKGGWCPFCRALDFVITPNISARQLENPTNDDEIEYCEFVKAAHEDGQIEPFSNDCD
jgi:hypothetical protein